MEFNIPRDSSRLSGMGESSLTVFGAKRVEFASKIVTDDATDSDSAKKVEQVVKKKQGSFTGVLIPTCENMWGVLIFLKFFTIVAEGGMRQALIAVLLSALAAYSTTVCLSSIASSGGLVSEG